MRHPPGSRPARGISPGSRRGLLADCPDMPCSGRNITSAGANRPPWPRSSAMSPPASACPATRT